MTLTYADCVVLLSTFIRKQNLKAPGEFGSGAIGHLFDALYREEGDFAESQRSVFPRSEREITESIWYQVAAGAKTPPEEPPPFTFDQVMSAIGTLSFVLGDAGPVAATGVNVLQNIVDNASRRLEWMRSIAQVSNPPDSPYQTVIDQLKAKIDDAQVVQDIESIQENVNKVQSMLNKVLIDPKDVKAAASGRIRTGNSLTKDYVLGSEGLGAVFALIDSEAWGRIQSADGSPAGRTLDAMLHRNPNYAQATVSVYLHVLLTVVNGLLAYAFIYGLPERALHSGWDGTNDDGSRYDPLTALVASRTVHSPAPTAWSVLELLFDRLNPETVDNPASWLGRLKDANSSWSAILARLSDVTLSTGQPAYRNKMWYLEKTKSSTRVITAKDSVVLHLWDVVTKSACQDGQVAFVDNTLNAAVRDAFVAPYRTFRTHLTQSWAMSDDAVTAILYSLTSSVAAAVEGETAIQVALWNKDFSSFDYPLVPDGSASLYNDVFWTEASVHDAALKDAATPGFLATSQGRDVCAWLGSVLAVYLAAYRFDVDLTNNTTTVEVSTVVRDLLAGVHLAVARMIGEQV
jgi:hypothetical protein